MEYIKNCFVSTVILLSSMLLSQYSYAHVMVAQHGTLNILDNGVFMVLSLPISAFDGVDDDNDGKLSSTEFSHHRNAIAKTIHKHVVLKDQSGKLVLQDMMLSPVTSHSHSHHSPKVPASQLIVMGRYNLVDSLSSLEYKVALFGTGPSEQLLEITTTRKSDHKKKSVKLTPRKSSVSIF